MNPPRPLRPGDPYTGIVRDYWPQLGDDPQQYDVEKAYHEVIGDRTLNLDMGEWDDIPQNATRALLRITCVPEAHFKRKEAPILAELWKTSRGLLYVSKLPGAVSDPGNDPDDPFAPPTAVLSKPDRLGRARVQSKRPRGPGREPVPITIVRILLDDPVMARASLWVKCADHSAAEVDRARLLKVYELDRERRRGHDTPEPTVIRLHDVVALFSEQ